MTTSGGSPQMAKYKLTRRGKKLQLQDDQRTLSVLPKDVPERTWYGMDPGPYAYFGRAEILQKEENDLQIFEIREEILDEAFRICYQKYMKKQSTLFTAYCAAEAWLKLINWHFYRHDPGEEPSAYPPCFIPKRAESWTPDELPDPSPKDSWGKQQLRVLEEAPEEGLKDFPSSSSIEIPVVEDIPQEYWFPGKVNLPVESSESTEVVANTLSYGSYEESVSSNLGTESEVLQNVTDYNTVEETSQKESTFSMLKSTNPVHGSLHGAGDSAAGEGGSAEGEGRERYKPKRRSEKNKVFSKPSVARKSRGSLPPLDRDSRSRISIVSDCRLRNLRLDTQYEIGSEKIDTPPGEPVKRK